MILDKHMEVTKLEWDLMERLRMDARAFEKSIAIAYFVLQLKKKKDYNAL